jgi:hypothetical protein
MAEEHTHEQLKERYIGAMGRDLGEVFHHLMQEAARLHLKWNEYVAVFDAGAEVQLLNRAAPGHFWIVQNACWNEILLHICRMTDARNDVLSVQRLSKLMAVGLRDEVKARLKTLEIATESVRDVRDRYIAHSSIDLALDPLAEPLASTDKQTIVNAITALDDLLYFVDNHFTKSGRIMYEHLGIRGGADSILDIVKRGLKDRDRQYEFIPDRPFPKSPE